MDNRNKRFNEYAARGKLQNLRQLIEQNPPRSIDPNWRNPDCFEATALIRASAFGRDHVVRWLLESTVARVNDKDRFGATALLYAASKGHDRVVKDLLDHGANVRHRDDWGESALVKAVTAQQEKVIQELVGDRMIDVNDEDPKGETVLAKAIRLDLQEAVKALRAKGASEQSLKNPPSLETEQFWTCVASGNISELKLLYEQHHNRVQVDWRNPKEFLSTPLMKAAANGSVEIVAWLLETAKASVRKRDKDGWTALLYGCAHEKVIELLIQHGANVNGKSPLGFTALMAAAWNGSLSGVRLLLDHGADLHARDFNNEGGMIKAAYGGHVKVAELLLERGTFVNLQNSSGKSALYQAADEGNLEMVRLLISKGANIHNRSSRGCTILLVAAESGHMGVVLELLSNGGVSDLNIQDIDGDTPVICAATQMHWDVVDVLREAGADMHIRNYSGESASRQIAALKKPKEGSAQIPNGHLSSFKPSESHHPAAEPVQAAPAAIASETRFVTFCQDGKLAELKQLYYLHSKDIDVNGSGSDSEKSSCLINAALNGHVEIVIWLLENTDSDVNKTEKYGWSALHSATRHQRVDIAKALLAYGAFPDIKKDDQWTPLHLASVNGLLGIQQLLLDYGAEVSVKNNEGKNSLMLAIQDRSWESIRLLINRGGADLELRDNVGCTALMVAAQDGDESVIRELMLRGAHITINFQSTSGDSALHYAGRRGLSEITEALLECGADIALKNNSGQCPSDELGHKLRVNYTKVFWQYALAGDVEKLKAVYKQHGNGIRVEWGNPRVDEESTALIVASYMNRRDVVAWMLENTKVDVNQVVNYGYTALMNACESGSVDIVKMLLDRGAKISSQDDKGQSALIWAVRHGHENVVSILLDHKADPHIKDENGRQALHYAAMEGYKNVVSLLLKAGSDLECRDINRLTPLQLACKEGEEQVVRVLLLEHARFGTGNNKCTTKEYIEEVLPFAVHGLQYNIVEMLLDFGADVCSKDGHGETPLVHAVRQGLDAMAKLLILRGANVHDQSAHQCTVLLLASQYGYEKIVVELLKSGASASINVQDLDGDTALTCASRNGYDWIVRLLLDHGADPRIQTKAGVSPLMAAAKHGRRKVLQELFRNGLDVGIDLQDKHGNNAVILAGMGRHSTVFQSLVRCGADLNAKNTAGKSGMNFLKHQIEIAVWNAVNHDDLALLRELYQQHPGTSANWKNPKVNLDTPLMRAAWKANFEIAKWLLENTDAKVNDKNVDQWTPLIAATSVGSDAIVGLFINHDANLDEHGHGGMTALMLAATKGNDMLVKLLLDHGANRDIGDEGRFTALEYAKSKKHLRCIELLKVEQQ